MTIRVLHVDDEPDIREIAAISLGLNSEFITRSCGSGSEAIAVAAEWPPDIILLDVMMPGMDGPATLVRLRANAITAGIPVVFMTARAQTRELDLFRSLGAVGVIPKPFDPMTLAASVRSHIEPIDSKLARLKSDFLHRLDNDVARLKKLAKTLKTGAARKVSLKQMGAIAHGLAGASGVFGFPQLGDLAAELEQAIADGGVRSAHIGKVSRSLDLFLAAAAARDAQEGLAF